MISLAQEFFDVVDEQDEVIDRRPSSECLELGLLHRAIAIFLFDGRDMVYLQRRAPRMKWYPGHWTVSVTGHVSSGETYEQAARREIREELGLDCELARVTKVKTPVWPYGSDTEREYLAIFKGRASRPKIMLSDESKEGEFVRFDEFVKKTREQPEKFTPDTLLALDSYLGKKAGSARKERPFSS